MMSEMVAAEFDKTYWIFLRNSESGTDRDTYQWPWPVRVFEDCGHGMYWVGMVDPENPAQPDEDTNASALVSAADLHEPETDALIALRRWLIERCETLLEELSSADERIDFLQDQSPPKKYPRKETR